MVGPELVVGQGCGARAGCEARAGCAEIRAGCGAIACYGTSNVMLG